MTHYTVVFQPSGKRGKIQEGKTLLDAARELGVDLESVCAGKGICGKCAVSTSDVSSLSSITDDERESLARHGYAEGYRLACRANLLGNVTVFVPESSRRVHHAVSKAAIRKKTIKVKPAVRRYYAEMSPPGLGDLIGDTERLLGALERLHGLRGLTVDTAVLSGLPGALRREKWAVTATVWMGREVISVQPGYIERSCGIAIDIGTTSVGGYLCDLESGQVLAMDAIMNPQVSYGEDVLSRINYAIAEKASLELLQKTVMEGINRLAAQLSDAAGIQPREIMEMVVVGNTAMHHLALGLNPNYLGRSPYVPAIKMPVNIKSRELGLNINPSANVHFLPNEAGFVGADNVGVIIAETPHKREKISLIIDIGTNGEIVLGNRERLLCASCAMGPALEGANIRHGMRAAPGAIEHVEIDPDTLDVTFKIVGNNSPGINSFKARGICGSGIIAAVAEMYRAGVINSSGRFNVEMESDRLVKGSNPEFVIARGAESEDGRGVTVTQADVRAMQLAKAAMYAGCRILMGRLGLSEVERVILAGAFGSHISKRHAMMMGMFPDCDLAKVTSVGNSAGQGALMALLNVDRRAEAERVARRVEYVELAADPEFNEQYMNALNIPHATHEFPHVYAPVKP